MKADRNRESHIIEAREFVTLDAKSSELVGGLVAKMQQI